MPFVGLRRTFGDGASVASGTAVSCGVGSGGVGGFEAVKVFVGNGFAVRAHFDETVAVGFESVLVRETAGVGDCHVFGVEGGDFVPVAAVGDAAEFGEENGERVVLVGLHFLVPAGLAEVRGVTPGVVVEGEEVGAGNLVFTTGEVVGLCLDVLGHICGRVADGDGAGRLGTDVVADITGDGLDVWGGVGVVAGVDHLVGREEKKKVVWV